MTQTTKLALADAVLEAYSAVGRNFGSFLILIGGWVAIGVAAWYGWLIAIDAAVAAVPSLGVRYSEWPEEGRLLFQLIPLALVSTAGTVSTVVAWHRLIIRRAVPVSPFPTEASAIFGYLGRLLTVFAIPFVPLALFMGAFAMIRDQSAEVKTIGVVILYIGMLGGLLVTMRFGLVMPAAAAGDTTMTLARSWATTEGHTWRLFFGTFLSALPFTIVQRILERLTADDGGVTGVAWFVLTAAGMLVEAMSYVAMAGFFSLAYLQLTGVRAAVDRPPASDFA